MVNLSIFMFVFLVLVVFMGFSFGIVLRDTEFKLSSSSTLEVLLEVKKSFSEDPLEQVLSDWSESKPNFCSWSQVSTVYQ